MFQGLYEMLIILSLLRQDVGDGQGGLACCDSWGRKESDTTERLIWSDTTTIYLNDLNTSRNDFFFFLTTEDIKKNPEWDR